MPNKSGSFDSSTSASLVNGGGVRSDILAGHVTVDHVYEVLPFGNEFMFLRLRVVTLNLLLKRL